MKKTCLFLRASCQRRVVVGAIKVSLTVGSILNLINQGEHILQGLPPSWPHLFLNYLVPYCVSTYSAARIQVIEILKKR